MMRFFLVIGIVNGLVGHAPAAAGGPDGERRDLSRLERADVAPEREPDPLLDQTPGIDDAQMVPIDGSTAREQTVWKSAPSAAIIREIEPAAPEASDPGGFNAIEFFGGGKLILTNGISSLEGSSGGGIARWATIQGLEMEGGIGAAGHATLIELPDFGWRSFGAAVGVSDRIEISYARQNFDTRSAGAALGLGEGFDFNQDVVGLKLRLAGDAVYGSSIMPQIAAGIEYKSNQDGGIVRALGAQAAEGVDYTLSATKLVLEHSLLLNAAARLTKANQLGLLGFGGPNAGYALQFEGSLGYQLSRRLVVGAEYRSKPDNLGLGEDDWFDLFAAYGVTDNITLSAAFVDLGSIATFENQRGGLVQAQIAF